MALKWNRYDIAKNYISNYGDKIKIHELDDLFELAVILDRVDFVNFFLEYGANINVLSVRRLYLLYNYEERVSFGLNFFIISTCNFYKVWK
jgi:hypothetical protein